MSVADDLRHPLATARELRGRRQGEILPGLPELGRRDLQLSRLTLGVGGESLLPRDHGPSSFALEPRAAQARGKLYQIRRLPARGRRPRETERTGGRSTG